ncbi:MAG: ABC transporter substrate-binding protein [Blastopirellula sp. JB062]
MADAIDREWKAREERPLEMTQATSAQLMDRTEIDADAIIYPPELLGELIRRQWIEELPPSLLENEALAVEDVFPALRQTELQWGGETYAVPFGSSTFVLMYRPEVFAELELTPPQTWREYQVCVDRIAASQFCAGDEAPFAAPTLEPLAEPWRSKWFLARAASYAKNPSNYAVLFGLASGDALIGQQSFVKAAEDLRRAADAIPTKLQSLSPAEAGVQFLAGKAPMAIGWLPHPAEENTAKVDFSPSFAPLPGAIEYWNQLTEAWERRRNDRPAVVPLLTVSGRIGSVATGSKNTRDAALGLILLSASDSAPQVSPASEATSVYRNTNLFGVAQWVDSRLSSEASSAYAEALATELSSSEAFGLNLPGASRYWGVLEKAIGEILVEGSDPKAILEKAAQAWDEVTDDLGRPAQVKAYSASLGV